MKKHIHKYILCSLLFIIFQTSNAQNPCVGTPGQVKWSYWLGFDYRPDSSDLKALENFPSRPDGSQMLGSLKSPVNFSENFASMIRGYIYVPTTETYKFQ
jgi:hypothetical protein